MSVDGPTRNRRNMSIKSTVEIALREAKFPQHLVDMATSSFDPSQSVSSYWASRATGNLIQAKGFSSFRALNSLLEEARAGGKPGKKIQVHLNARYITSLLKCNDALLADDIRNDFITRLKDFRKASGTASTEAVLSDIRQNCLLSASLYLDSNLRPHSMSLEELSNVKDEDCATRELQPRDLEKLFRICKTAKNTIDLVSNEANFPLSFSCFHCSSLAEKKKDNESDDEQNMGESNFVDSILAHFNVLKVYYNQNYFYETFFNITHIRLNIKSIYL